MMFVDLAYADISKGYTISPYGDIQNKDGILLKPYINEKGYKQYNPSRSFTNPRRSIEVHVLVAHMFIGPRPEGMYINHIDCNKLNCHYSNLEYVTPLRNAQHARENNLYEVLEDRYNASLTNEEVHMVCSLLESNVQYDDILEQVVGLTRDVLKKIRSGDNYREISKHYKLSNHRIKRKYSVEIINAVMDNIKLGLSSKEVLRNLELPINSKTINMVKNQRRKLKRIEKGSTTIENPLFILAKRVRSE